MFPILSVQIGESITAQPQEHSMEFATGPSEQQIETNKRSIKNWCTKTWIYQFKNTWRSPIPPVWRSFRKVPRHLGKDSAISYPCIVEVDISSDGNIEWGFFGLVSFVVVITHYRKYLVGLSLRISGYTTHSLLGLNTDSIGLCFKAFSNFLLQQAQNKFYQKKAKELLLCYISVADVNKACVCDLSVFAKTAKKV